jgi:hypothetical protein
MLVGEPTVSVNEESLPREEVRQALERDRRLGGGDRRSLAKQRGRRCAASMDPM